MKDISFVTGIDLGFGMPALFQYKECKKFLYNDATVEIPILLRQCQHIEIAPQGPISV